jgi:hypothetical protein
MRLINTKAHGIYDYLMAGLLMMSPGIFGYNTVAIAPNISVAVGVALLLTCAFTNFESGLMKLMSIKGHMALDLILGLFLCTSPWIFGYDDKVFKPQLVFGLSIIVVSFLTDRLPCREVRLLMVRAKHKSKPVPAPKPKTIPAFKLILDPFEALAFKAFKRSDPVVLKSSRAHK